MTEKHQNEVSRGKWLSKGILSTSVAGAVGAALPHVHAAEDNTIRVALIGCGFRGTGAVSNALSVEGVPVRLTAMADVFESRIESSLKNLTGAVEARYDRLAHEGYERQIEVPKDRQFVGFDAYKKAMDCLRPGDIAILATPLAFRWLHFGYAVERGLNVFMEKPLTADAVTSRRILEVNRQAEAKNLKVGVGLMSRHARNLQQLRRRVLDGELGDILLMRAYRMHGPGGTAFSQRWPGTPSELLWQIQRFHSFLWAGGGVFSDFYIHLIDHCCWLKDAWPIKAQGIGGRHFRGDCVDQNFDFYNVEYTFADGSKLRFNGRCMHGTFGLFSSFLHGSKGCAIASRINDCGGPSSMYRGQSFEKADQVWQSDVPPGEISPYQNHWNALMAAIVEDRPFNEVESGVMASLVTSMGRKAAHTGIEVTLDDMLSSSEEYAPGLEHWTEDSPPPLRADAEGRYPIPQPGIVTDREY
ncbi:MAG: Gfo/Idh/MocA family oxidoreductase [Thermogutta sp.]